LTDCWTNWLPAIKLPKNSKGNPYPVPPAGSGIFHANPGYIPAIGCFANDEFQFYGNRVRQLRPNEYLWIGDAFPPVGIRDNPVIGVAGRSGVYSVSMHAYVYRYIHINAYPLPRAPNELAWAHANPWQGAAALAASSIGQTCKDWAARNAEARGWGVTGGRTDAARHFRWNADMAVHPFIGGAYAEQIADAHERTNFEDEGRGLPNPHEASVMDYINNAASRNFARTRGAVRAADWLLVAVMELNAGRMVHIENPARLLIPTNKKGTWRWDMLGLP
jgi:hypothetical protein